MLPPPAPYQSILILCEGNHCRSPIAECLFRAALGPTVRVESAGLHALVGVPADAEVQQVMAEHGWDLSAHRGRQWTLAMASSADLLLVMEHTQKTYCEQVLPGIRGRVFLLGQWLGSRPQEIRDPYRRGRKAIRESYEKINRAVGGWLDHMTHQ